MIDKQIGVVVQQVADMMEVVEDGEFEQDNRICLVVIDQNAMRGTVGECSSSKSKSGENGKDCIELSWRR